MAYGRLDVYWPNGEFNSYLLSADSVSIGRSSGSTIVLDTDTLSRYHANIRRENEQTFISDMDSANGTFVDGIQLIGDESKLLLGGEEIQIGHLRMIFYAEDDHPTMPLEELDIDTQRFEREEFGFRIDVHTPETGIPPGSHKSLDITITNITEEEKLYTVSVTGLPNGWGRVNRPTLRIAPDETEQVFLNIKPPRMSSSKPGSYAITIIVAHEDDPDKRIEAYATVDILPYHAFAMALLTKRVTLYDRLALIVQNQGSEPLPIHISATSADDALEFELPQPQRILGPGERAEVRGAIRPRHRPLFGAPQEHAFDVLVRSQDDARFLTAMRGRFIAEPILPPWSAYALGGLALGILALLVAAVFLLSQISSAPPEITRFTSEAVQVTSGEPIRVSWEGDNAEGYRVLVNGAQIHDAPANTTSYAIDTTPYGGQQITVELVAYQGDKTDSSDLIITVLAGLRQISFTVNPPVLVRNVIGTLNVRWEIDGATETRLEGVEAILGAANAPVSVPPSYGEQANFDIQGYATDNFSLTLFALGENDAEESWTVNVDVVDALCTPTVQDFRLYDAPRSNANVVRTYAELPGPLVVDRIDPSRQWLRTLIDGGQYVWGARNELDCADNFQPENLRIEVVDVPMTPTPPAGTAPSAPLVVPGTATAPTAIPTQTRIPATQTPLTPPADLPSGTETTG